ncbi:MAG: hypothetical protein COA45_06830 [Zetaproteobacteria bacterium]|nr:MAG: hypothetical protein COA45_06830 [Zetaproteobacteria bacterium]
MSDDAKIEEGDNDPSGSPYENGTTNLLIGGGIGAYGTTMAVSVGYICPFCLIATPLFLGMGAVQRFRYLRNNSEKTKA